MPQGSKASYSSKQRRKAGHIEDSVKERGGSTKTAERIAWATVNKQDGGAKGSKARKKAAGRNASAGGRSGSSRTSASKQRASGSRSSGTKSRSSSR